MLKRLDRSNLKVFGRKERMDDRKLNEKIYKLEVDGTKGEH